MRFVAGSLAASPLSDAATRGIIRRMDATHWRVGQGHDTHRLVPNRPLILGGVPIEFDRGLLGHSDADILLHAVTDAVLGAAGLGDIGEAFPDTDPAFAGIDSAILLERALKRVSAAGWRVVNLDCTIFAERPKLSPHKPAIRRRLSELLGVAVDAVNVKAKTGERIGPVGREEAMSAEAVVLLEGVDKQ
jgi:2-C-methyl-D-erythritol 2,4-cyclodiphosphate synthase